MSKNDTYSLWESKSQYASSVWNSWGKDVDEYVDDVMETDSRSDDELYASTVVQDSAHSGELVAHHLVGSVFSNEYTKERAHEIGTAIASTDSYKSATQTAHEIEPKVNQATEAFMQEHPRVQTAIMATGEQIAQAKDYVTQEAHTFAKITNDLQSIVEIAAVVPAVKAGKVLHQAHELEKMDKIDYKYTQGRELNGGIFDYVDKKSIDNKELAVTAEAKVDNTHLFDVNQQARTTAHPETPALRHDEIRVEEAKIKSKNDIEIEKAEKDGNPKLEEEIAKIRSRETKPNATLAQSHAETAVIQRAYEQGLTQDAHMFIKVNGQEVCGNCNSNTYRMAEKAGLKSITIHDYKIDNTQRIIEGKKPLDPIIHWNKEAGRKRYESFEALENTFKDLPKTPEHIKHSEVIEPDRLRMNKMDVTLMSAGGAVLMNESAEKESTLDQEVLEQRINPETKKTVDFLEVQDKQSRDAFNTSKANEIVANMLSSNSNNYIQQQQQREEPKEEPNQSQTYESRDINNSSDTFKNNDYYIEDDFSSMPKNHIPSYVENNIPQQSLEENEPIQEIGQHIYDEKYGSNNDYGNDYDVGMDID